MIEVDLKPEPSGGRDRGRPPGANGVDDLAGINALRIRRRGSEVGVLAKLALNDVDRYPFTGELDGVRTTKLVGRQPPPGRRRRRRAGAVRRGRRWRPSGGHGWRRR